MLLPILKACDHAVNTHPTCMQRSEDNQLLVLPRDAVNMDVMNGAAAALNDLLTNAFFGAL